MNQREHLHDLTEAHKAIWVDKLHGWLASAEDVAAALSGEGFDEYRRELIRSRRDRRPLGGLWQGLDSATGSVASMIWVNRVATGGAIVFVDVDGELLEGEETGMEAWWSELDDAVLRCLSEGAMEPAEIGRRLGFSEDAAASLIAMLAREGKVRICLVAAATTEHVAAAA